MYWDGMHGWGGWLGAGWMLLLWVVLIATGVWAIYRLTRSGRTTSSPVRPPVVESPIEILDRRFASGVIGVDEYSERRARLEHGTSK